MLEHEIDSQYKEFCERRAKERANASFTKTIIMATVTTGAAVLGGVVSLIAPPIGAGVLAEAFSSAVAIVSSASVGASIASVANSFIPKKKFFGVFKKNQSNDAQQCADVPSVESSISPHEDHDAK